MKRECGDCTLCCKLLPIPELKKPAAVKCAYQRHGKGCTVHGTDKQPHACKLWYCRWLLNDDMAHMSRPDRARYVIDMLPDEITMEPDDKSAPKRTYLAIQIWADGEAWKDDNELFKWVERRAAEGFPTLIRSNAHPAVGVFAPSLSPTGKWQISQGTINKNLGLWR